MEKYGDSLNDSEQQTEGAIDEGIKISASF